MKQQRIIIIMKWNSENIEKEEVHDVVNDDNGEKDSGNIF